MLQYRNACPKFRLIHSIAVFLMIGLLFGPNARAQTDNENKSAAAKLAFAEGEILRNQTTAPSLRKSIEKYQEALTLYRQAADQRGEAQALCGIGRAYDSLSEKKNAVEFYNQAVSVFHSLNDRSNEARTLGYMALDYDYLGEKQKGIELGEQAIKISREAGDRTVEAIVLTYTGQVYNNFGNKQKALEYYNLALPLHRATGNRKGEATTLSYIGGLYISTSETQKALDNLNQALALYKAENNVRDVAYTLTTIGVVYYSLDDYQKALEYFTQSVPLWREVGDRSGESSTLHNIAGVYDRTGEFQKALDFYYQSASISRSVNYKIGEANTLNNIGRVYSALGDKEKALDFYNQTLPIQRTTGNRRGEAATLNNIGAVYNLLGERQKALDCYNQALALNRAISDQGKEAETLGNIGEVHFSLGESQKALDFNNQALSLHKAVGSPRGQALSIAKIGRIYAFMGEREKALDLFNQALPLFRLSVDRNGEATTLYSIARVERDRNNLVAARTRVEEALAIIESLRSKVVSQDLRSSYFASVRDYFDLEIDLLMQQHKQRPSEGFDAAALQASERARARSLLEILNESRAEIRQGVDPSLLERLHSLQQLLNAKAERQIRLLNGKHTEEQASAIAKEIEAITTEYGNLEAQIKAASPRYAALIQPQPLNLKETQRLLDSDTLLLEYALGEERSFLWAVSSDSINSFELPGRADIEKAARSFYELVRADTQDEKFLEPAFALSRMLLSQATGLTVKRRLVIIADGALQYVPFAALPLLNNQTSTAGSKAVERYQPLIVEHEIVNLPSAFVLAALRRENEGRKPAPKTIAVIADPVFNADDLRVKRGTGDPAAAPADAQTATRDPGLDLERSVRESGISDGKLRLARLINSRREAIGILALVPEKERKQALDFEADRATVTGGDLADYRIIHFATHGLLNSAHPELSGLVLSLVDQQGNPQDGFLRLHEIYNLKLPADLIVLSACQTGLGKEIKSEGLIGLTRGFIYAGAARVIASLWKVDDKATSELMGHFYKGMLGSQRLHPAAALRAAQLAIWKQKQWQAPYYWAAFGLQGELK